MYSKVNPLYIYTHAFLFRFYSHIGHCRVLSRVGNSYFDCSDGLVLFLVRAMDQGCSEPQGCRLRRNNTVEVVGCRYWWLDRTLQEGHSQREEGFGGEGVGERQKGLQWLGSLT